MTRFRRGLVVSTLLITAFFALIAAFFIFSSAGSQLLFAQVERWVPQFQGELVEGSLNSGWHIKDFSFENETVLVKADKIDADWSLSSIFSHEFYVEQLSSKNLVVNTKTTTQSEEDDNQDAATALSLISTPVAIYVRKLSLNQFHYEDSTVSVSADSLNSAASWVEDHIKVDASQAEQVDVFLKPAPQQASPKVAVKKAVKDVLLPHVFVPFDIELVSLNVVDARYHQAGFDTGLANIQLSATLKGDALQIRQLNVSQGQRSVNIDGKMSFVQSYPLELSVGLKSELIGIAPAIRTVNGEIGGDLQSLTIALNLEGAEKLTVQGKLKTLTKNLPFEFNAAWQSLPQIDSAKEISVQKGQLKLRGDLSAYAADLSAKGAWQNYPAITVTSQLSGNMDGIALKKLNVADDRKNDLTLSGDLSWKQGIIWKGDTVFDVVDIADWTDAVVAKLKGLVKQEIIVKNNHWQMKLNDIKTSGSFNHLPFSATGDVAGNDLGDWQIDQLKLKNGQNSLLVNGHLNQEWNLKGSLDVKDFTSLYKNWSGSLNGSFNLQGKKQSPSLAVALSSPRLSVAGLNVRTLASSGHVVLNQQYPGELNLSIDRLQTNGFRQQDVQLSLKGDLSKHVLVLATKGKQLSSNLAVRGGWLKSGWAGTIEDADFNTDAGRWKIQQPVTVNYRNQLVSFKSHCWVSEPTKLCLADGQAGAAKGKIPFTLTDLEPKRFTAWMPNTLKWKGKFDGSGVIAWQANKPDIKITLSGAAGEIIAEDIHTPYQRIQLSVDANSRKAALDLSVSSERLGNINVLAQVTDPLKRQQLSGQIAIKAMNLDGIAPLVDALHSTSGVVNADGRLDGTLSAPLFFGQLTLDNGEVETSTDMLSLREINGRIVIEGDKATLTAKMKAGDGDITVSGRSFWPEGEPSGVLTLHSDKMGITLAGYGKGSIDSDISLNFDKSGIKITGQVQVPKARIEVESLPEEGVELSDDVQIVRQNQNSAVAKSPALPMNIDLDLRLGDDVRLKAMGLTAQLSGGLRIRQKPGQSMTAQGNIYVVNGRFKAYGQNLVIRTGRLIFNGDISQPYIVAEAIRDPSTMEDTSVTVGVKINAPMNAITAQIFSEPEMPDTDKLSYLLRGKSSTATTNGSTEEAMAAMMIGAGLGQANGIVSDVASTFGLKDAAFDTSGSGSDTKVNLSAYLLKDLQIQYGMGVYSAVSEVTLKYFFLPKLYLQAVSGLSQAVDLFYKFEF